MFVIKRDSWHYRLASHWNPMVYYCNSLCPYMRNVMYALLFRGFFMAIMVVAGLVLLAGTADVFYGIYHTPQAITVLAAIVSAAVFTAIYYGSKYIDYLRRKNRYNMYLNAIQPESPKQPGIIRLWLRSLHERVCPMIKIEELESDNCGHGKW